MSEQQVRRLAAELEPPCCEYCGTRIEDPDQSCPGQDEGVCDA